MVEIDFFPIILSSLLIGLVVASPFLILAFMGEGR